MDHHRAIGRERASGPLIERGCIQFPDAEIRRVRKIGDDEVEHFVVVFQPAESVAVDHADLR